MSHTPPVPAGNTSPYPRAEPPHDKGASAVATPPTKAVSKRDESRPSLGWPLVAGAIVAGAGLLGGVLYALTANADDSRKQPRKRKRKANR